MLALDGFHLDIFSAEWAGFCGCGSLFHYRRLFVRSGHCRCRFWLFEGPHQCDYPDQVAAWLTDTMQAHAETMLEYGPTPGCKQCEEAEACGLTDCPECDAQLCEDVNGDGVRPDA